MTKIALITGGSRGLGKSMALHLAHKGFDIILTYNSRRDDANAVVEGIVATGRKALALQLDVTCPDTFSDFSAAVQTVLKTHWQRTDFDVLINNAGMGIFKPFTDTSEADLDQLFSAHFKAPFLLTQKLLPVIRDSGRILNISSGLTRFSMPGYSAYASMKGAVEVLTAYMAQELGHRKIVVNALAPGAIETDFGGGAVRDNRELNDFVASNTVLGRAGLPDDIGAAVAALLDDGSGWINGQRIEASGGMHL